MFYRESDLLSLSAAAKPMTGSLLKRNNCDYLYSHDLPRTLSCTTVINNHARFLKVGKSMKISPPFSKECAGKRAWEECQVSLDLITVFDLRVNDQRDTQGLTGF